MAGKRKQANEAELEARVAALEEMFANPGRRNGVRPQLRAMSLIIGSGHTQALSYIPDQAGGGFFGFIAKSRPVLALGTNPQGWPALYFCDETTKLRQELYVDGQGCPRVRLAGTDGQTRADLTVDPRGAPTLSLNTPEGKAAVAAYVTFDGKPVLAQMATQEDDDE